MDFSFTCAEKLIIYNMCNRIYYLNAKLNNLKVLTILYYYQSLYYQ